MGLIKGMVGGNPLIMWVFLRRIKIRGPIFYGKRKRICGGIKRRTWEDEMHHSQGSTVGENMEKLGELVGGPYCISLYKEYME